MSCAQSAVLAWQVQRLHRPAGALGVVLDHRQIAQEGSVWIDPPLRQIAQAGDVQAVDLGEGISTGIP